MRIIEKLPLSEQTHEIIDEFNHEAKIFKYADEARREAMMPFLNALLDEYNIHIMPQLMPLTPSQGYAQSEET